jgi:threonine dehydratase
MTTLATHADIRAAAAVISGHVLRTPTVPSPGLSALLGRPVSLKLETMQISGCFKPRGIAYRVSRLSAEERRRGILTFSGGNHGMALAMIAGRMGVAATVVVPANASALAKRRIEAAGARLVVGADMAEVLDIVGREKAKGAVFVDPLDDAILMAGHGTVGLEFIEDCPDLTDVIASVGVGALLAGSAVAIKGIKPSVRVWGVETEGADAMSRALAAGKPERIKVTSISATLGAPYVVERALAHVQALVERVFVVSDAAAVEGMRIFAEEAKLWVEPAAGVLIPAAREVIARVGPQAKIGLVVCGGSATWDEAFVWRQRFAPAPTPAA